MILSVPGQKTIYIVLHNQLYIVVKLLIFGANGAQISSLSKLILSHTIQYFEIYSTQFQSHLKVNKLNKMQYLEALTVFTLILMLSECSLNAL